MKKFTKFLRVMGSELRSTVHLFFVWLMILFSVGLAVLSVIGYFIARLGNWILANPIVLISILVLFLSIFVGFLMLKWYVLGREIMVERDMAVIVRRVNGRLESLYRGWHTLNIGDRVCVRLPLRLESGETNQEEASTCDGERVRLAASYRRFTSDPVQYYLHRSNKVDFTGLNRWAILSVIQDFGANDVYNLPDEINATIEQLINEELRDYGEQIGNYLLDEAIWPETNERWLRGKELLPSSVGRYWNEIRRLRRRHC